MQTFHDILQIYGWLIDQGVLWVVTLMSSIMDDSVVLIGCMSGAEDMASGAELHTYVLPHE